MRRTTAPAFLACLLCFLLWSPSADAQGARALRGCLAARGDAASHPLLLASCITGRVASLGPSGRDAGPSLLALAEERDGLVRAAAISALGRIGFEDAQEFIGNALTSEDWRVALAAARSIGWLGGSNYISGLRRLAEEHWLPDVREQARISIEALESPARRRLVQSDLRPGYIHLGPMIGAEGVSIGNAPPCPSGQWIWDNVVFRMPDRPRMRLAFASGDLLGSDAGEWGGSLTWIRNGDQPVEVYDDNVHGIERAGESAVVAVGIAHLGLDYGSVLLVHPTTPPSTTTLLILPGAPHGLATVRTDETYVAWSHGYAIVFDLNGVKGIAPCVP